MRDVRAVYLLYLAVVLLGIVYVSALALIGR
ncbi:MAG: hypothetical protein AVDCRST_MAG52-1087 [uncultured Blastococcus sp.]|uniref:Uncharacterized protein n=1 Tax=uncultured Blastococcus sp. TaxID=217144 RepID=A0A6J4GYK7_9ACTN|nr:MAG: hypothetical protein AVDCRST_MAG52-1087 [uncultured Blastococcus sp.]